MADRRGCTDGELFWYWFSDFTPTSAASGVALGRCPNRCPELALPGQSASGFPGGFRPFRLSQLALTCGPAAVLRRVSLHDQDARLRSQIHRLIAACAAIEVLVVLPRTIARERKQSLPCTRVPGAMCAPVLRRAVVVVLPRHRDTSLFVLFFSRHSLSVTFADSTPVFLVTPSSSASSLRRSHPRFCDAGVDQLIN